MNTAHTHTHSLRHSPSLSHSLTTTHDCPLTSPTVPPLQTHFSRWHSSLLSIGSRQRSVGRHPVHVRGERTTSTYLPFRLRPRWSPPSPLFPLPNGGFFLHKNSLPCHGHVRTLAHWQMRGSDGLHNPACLHSPCDFSADERRPARHSRTCNKQSTPLDAAHRHGQVFVSAAVGPPSFVRWGSVVSVGYPPSTGRRCRGSFPSVSLTIWGRRQDKL